MLFVFFLSFVLFVFFSSFVRLSKNKTVANNDNKVWKLLLYGEWKRRGQGRSGEMETRRRNKRKVAREQESFSLKVPPSFSPPSPNFQGALPPAPPEAISGPLFAAAEVAPGAGDRLLLRLVCEMIRAKSSCFFVFVFFVEVEVERFWRSSFSGCLFFPHLLRRCPPH